MGSLLGSLRIRQCIVNESNLFRTSLSFLCGDPSLLSVVEARERSDVVEGKGINGSRPDLREKGVEGSKV